MKLKPNGSRVLVRRDDVVKKIGSFEIPQNHQKAPTTGIVVAVGNGARKGSVREKMTVRVGDRVVFGKYAGHPVQIDLEMLTLMFEVDIYAVIDEGLKVDPVVEALGTDSTENVMEV